MGRGRHQSYPGSGLPINADWGPAKEAHFFFQLFNLREITAEEARADILMSKKQLAWLVTQFPEEMNLIKRIHERRIETHQEFQRLLLKRGSHGSGCKEKR